jgi:hypothetical protein
MWKSGIIAIPETGNQYKYHAKVYDTGSQFGLREGRVSKLEIREVGSNKCVFHFDRGEDVPPANEEVAAVLEIILAKYPDENPEE